MTLDEAKRYFLENRHNQEAFFAYMDKLEQFRSAIVIDPTDPESEANAISAIQQKLDLHPKQWGVIARENYWSVSAKVWVVRASDCFLERARILRQDCQALARRAMMRFCGIKLIKDFA